MSITVLKPGVLTSVQDCGRDGWGGYGVGTAGAMDRTCLRLANALVGNGEDAAALEITASGPSLRFAQASHVALTGAECELRIDGTMVRAWQAHPVRAGSIVEIGRVQRGWRAYLALAGGLATRSVLGSSASDLNAGLGPFDGRALRAGDELAVHSGAIASGRRFTWSLDPRPWFDADPGHRLHLIRGSHHDVLDESSQRALREGEFRIASQSNRVGLRLQGPHLALRAALELVSEPVAFGSMQLPPSGQPIILMAEHPTIGGYPRIAQVAGIDLPRLVQRRPGESVRFVCIEQDEAQTRYLARERELARLLGAIAERLAP